MERTSLLGQSFKRAVSGGKRGYQKKDEIFQRARRKL
jgi:hypothetical protein